MRYARQSRVGTVGRGLCLPLVLVASLLVAGGVATAASASTPVQSAVDVYYHGTVIRGCVTRRGC